MISPCLKRGYFIIVYFVFAGQSDSFSLALAALPVPPVPLVLGSVNKGRVPVAELYITLERQRKLEGGYEREIASGR